MKGTDIAPAGAHQRLLNTVDTLFGGLAAVMTVAAVLAWTTGRGGPGTVAVFAGAAAGNLLLSVASRRSAAPLRWELGRALLGTALAPALYVLTDGPLAGWWFGFPVFAVGGALMLGLLTGSPLPGRLLVVYYVVLFLAAEIAAPGRRDWYVWAGRAGLTAATGLLVAEVLALFGALVAGERRQRRELELARAASEEMARRQAETAARSAMESALRFVAEGTAASTGHDFFTSLVRSLAAALDVRHAFVAEVVGNPPSRVRTIAFWSDGRPFANIEYALENTPCEGVVAGDVCYYPQRVQEVFPTDPDLVTLGAESYLGTPMVNREGEVLGHVAVLDDRPMWDEHWRKAVLGVFGARAGAELERLRTEQALRELNDALAMKVATRGAGD